MTANLETGSPAPPETGSPAPRSRWETIVWPTWLPVRARLPLIAQITGAVALVAAIAMPRWAEVAPTPAVTQATPVPQVTPIPQASVPPAPVPQAIVPEAPVPQASTVTPTPTQAAPEPPPRPAHLNLDVRHAFRSADLSVTVDGKRVLDTTLEGSGKRFKVFGKRAGKAFTKSLDLAPGVRVVRVRVRSEADKFDQTRVERFDLDSASVAGMRIAADKSGLSIVAERPPAPERRPAPPPTQLAQVTQVTPAAQVAEVAPAPQGAPAPQQATPQDSALAELYKTLRSILIAVAGFVGSAATGYVVQEFLRSRREMMGR